MKKLVSVLVSLFLLCTAIILPVSAAGSTTLSLAPSSSTIRIGDTITVTGNFSGAMVGTFDIQIKYNAAQLTFVSAEGISPAIKSGEMDVNASSGSIQLLYLDADGGTTGITNGGAFKVKFTVTGGNVGDGVSVSVQITTVGDSNAAAMSASANPASMTIAAPLSGNTFLSSLTVSNGTLAPAFSKSVYAYSVSVPFSVDKLNVSANPEDVTSSVSINSPTLAAGATTDVSIIVTAQSGAKKTYVITVARERDPNYKASGNANLKSLVPNQGILSPVFSPDVTEYVIYLPYEITSFNATAEMEDAKALGASGTEIQLEVGENVYTMTGKAEDGTEKAYTIKVNRMPQPGASTSNSGSISSESSSGSEDFQITISGILTDDQGNPLAGKTVELHSDPQTTTTDTKGYYEFKNVVEGSHTLYVKEPDGTPIAQLPIVITKGEQTSAEGNAITAKGNTTLDLSLKGGTLTVKNVAETVEDPMPAGTNGVPVYLVIILVLISLALGFAASYFFLGNGKLLYTRKRVDEEDNDDQGPFKIV